LVHPGHTLSGTINVSPPPVPEERVFVGSPLSRVELSFEEEETCQRTPDQCGKKRSTLIVQRSRAEKIWPPLQGTISAKGVRERAEEEKRGGKLHPPKRRAYSESLVVKGTPNTEGKRKKNLEREPSLV